MPLEKKRCITRQTIVISTYPPKMKPTKHDNSRSSDQSNQLGKIIDEKLKQESLYECPKICKCHHNDGKISQLMCSICLNTRCEKCLQPTTHFERSYCALETGPKKDIKEYCDMCGTYGDSNTGGCKDPEICRYFGRVEMKNSATQDSKHSLLCKTSATKDVQTSQTDLGKLDLLKLVLKLDECSCKQHCKTHYSDALNTASPNKSQEISKDDSKMKSKSNNLAPTEVYQISLGKSVLNFQGNESAFKVMNFNETNVNAERNNKICFLLKSKSSSVPFMKIDELKNSLKDKQKAKDSIEEVNRLFANVRRNTSVNNNEELNRPCTRTGPRILPVVKSPNYSEDNETSNAGDRNKAISQKSKASKINDLANKCSHGRNIEYSQGHKTDKETKKCIYTLCCRHRGLSYGRVGDKHGDSKTQTDEAFNTCRCKCRKEPAPRNSDHSGNSSSTFF